MRKTIDIQQDVAAIGDLSREDLCQHWRKIYGHAPPKGVRRELMIKAVAWQLQSKRLGGYTTETRRLLRSVIDAAEKKLRDSASARHKVMSDACNGQAGWFDTANGGRNETPADESDAAPAALLIDPRLGEVQPSRSSAQRQKPRPGARLLRDWNGKTHIVDVIEDGFVFEAKIYTSLSAIARKITNAHWSGPRFFGL